MAKLSENLNLQVPEPMDTVNRAYFEKLILDIDEKVASQKDLEKALDGSAIASKTVTEHSYKGSNKNVESALSSIDKALDGVSETSKTEVKRISEDVRSHKLTYGGTGKYGHVMLSDATDLISSAANHTAATPLAVKKAMDRADSAYVRAGTAMGNASLAQNKADKAQSRADSAYTKADQAFQHGNERKKEVVDGLLSVDDSLPIGSLSSWSDVVKAIPQIEAGAKKHFEIVPKGVTVVSGLPFEPQTIQILSSKNETINYGVVGAVLVRPFIISDKGDVIQVYFEGNSIRFNEPFSVEVYLDIYG